MPYTLALFCGLIFTIALTPVALWIAHKFNLIDYPSPTHPGNLQTKPLPRAGGLAMYGAFIISVLLLVHPISTPLMAIIIAAGLNVIVGTLDDRHNIHPIIRLGTLALSGVIIIAAGISIPFVTNPFASVNDHNLLIYLNHPFIFLNHTFHPFADSIALFWIMWLINSLNWSKGIGGQLSGISAIAAITLGGTALMFTNGNPAQFTTAILCFIVAGCALGFLPFNFPPEKQLPGYGASSFLGLMLAVLSILSGAKLAAAILVLGIPTIDGIITVFRRLAQGKLPIWGDSSHLYHKLLNLGLSKRQIVILYWVATAIFGTLALALSGQQKIYAFAIVGIIIIATFLTVSYLLTRQRRLSQS
jgi:UDP-GlcNAc:undecaprenyl-phosphate GlcNAc-1-phosphate transferase